jgi:endonuclease/exonuclease/phosphatase family metal-dependent hydrolase
MQGKRLLAIALTLLTVACGDDDDGDGIAAAGPDLTVASVNILNGLRCPPETAQCRLQERVGLFYQWVAMEGCPDVVTVQEVLGNTVAELIAAGAGVACPFPYSEVTDTFQIVILSRYAAERISSVTLHGGVRMISHARLDHPLGLVDVFTTHLAAGIDRGSDPCGPECPVECVAAEAQTNRDCQAVQVVDFVERTHDLPTPAIITGDFNARPDTFVYEHLTEAGWTDAYLFAGNPECDPMTGSGCTSGREDQDLSDLESPEDRTDRRIDYIFVIPPASDDAQCEPAIDSALDDDGDGFATQIFANDPNPFANTCGPLPAAICWPSDHKGMQADVNCR